MGMEAHGARENRVWSMSSILSAEQFRAVQLTYVEQMTQTEVAREIGLSQSMVCILLTQAYDRLRAARNIVLDFDPTRI